MMRFKYSTTLFFEDHGGYICVASGILFCTVVDCFNPLFHTHSVLYYAINIAAFVFGGVVLPLKLGGWMRDRTIWASEWEKEYGGRLGFGDKVAAFIPVLVALWNCLGGLVLLGVLLTIVGSLIYMWLFL